jgi:hypothetical protein
MTLTGEGVATIQRSLSPALTNSLALHRRDSSIRDMLGDGSANRRLP